MAVLDQAVTAQGNWLQRNSYTSHWSWSDDCLNLLDQSASLLSATASWSKVTIDKKTFPTRFVQLPVSLILSDPTPASYWLFCDLDLQFQGDWWPLKGQILAIFSHFGPVLIYRKLDHPMAGIHETYICPL